MSNERGKAFKSSAQTQALMKTRFTKAGLNISALVFLQFLEVSLHEGDARAPRATKITIIHCVPSTDMEVKILTKWPAWGTGAGLVSEKM